MPRRRGGGPEQSPAERPGRMVTVGWTLAGLLVIGLLLGVAVHNTEANAPSANSAREGLVADIDRAQVRADGLEGSANALAAQVRDRQAELGVPEAPASASVQAVAAGTVGVSGPGLTVTIDNPSGEDNDVILDRDIQLLVNGLWAGGAEAIAVGGVRLQPTSAIRKAGGAILVDNRPVFWPITIAAIGNPATLPAEFAGTSGYGRFASFVSLYSITFDVVQADTLTLPAATEPVLRYASVPNTASSTPTPTSHRSPVHAADRLTTQQQRPHPPTTSTVRILRQPEGDHVYAALALVVGIVAGVFLAPTVPDWLAPYLPIAVVAALDAVFGGLRAKLDAVFDAKVFVVSFVANVLVAAFIVFLGDQLGVGAQLSTAVVVVLGIRIFGNAAAIRRHIFKA